MEEFLKKRGIENDVIQQFKDEKVDEAIVQQMSDQDLIRLGLRSLGDRIALKSYVKCQIESDQNANTIGLLDRVKEKLKNPKRTGRWVSLRSNSNAKTELRTVEFGWLNDDVAGLKQVRSRTGGGTRSLKVSRETNVSQLKDMACELFFPGGTSSHRGEASDYSISMVNFDCSSLDADDTVDSLYQKSAQRLLRLYLLTKPISVSPVKKRLILDTNTSDTNANPTTDTPANPVKKKRVLDTNTTDTTANETSDTPASPVKERPIVDTNTTDTNVNATTVNPQALIVGFPGESIGAFKDDSTGTSETVLVHAEHSVVPLESDLQMSFDDEVTFNLNPSSKNLVVWLHRGMVLTELEDFFLNHDFNVKTDSLTVKLISQNGSVEAAEDNGGVLRDVLSEYWDSFYEKRTIGRDLKVPVISDRVDGARWKASSKILFIGYYIEDYFPVKLASCFLDYVVHGENIDSDFLLNLYITYFLPSSEMEIVKNALDDFDTADADEILDFLTDHKCTSVARRDNIRRIIFKIAHKELIQAPTYVAKYWKEYLTKCEEEMKGRGTDFVKMNQKKSTFKEVWRSVDIAFDANQDVVGYLKKFLKEIDAQLMKYFLRFCTGADIVVGKTLKVSTFTPESDFTRRPIAHTCGCTLELPNSYQSFVDFRTEMNGILNSGVWVMDIV